MKKQLVIADLFCGAGGTSTGAVMAAERAGYTVKLTAINHWPVAVATHAANHPNARHLCTNIDDVDPLSLFKRGELDILMASPECTHHSRARGGKPMDDQSRCGPLCVVRWAEKLLPGIIYVENVKEFEEWGPLGTNGRPLKSMKGKTFTAWVGMLRSLGYKVDWRPMCCADHGVPSTRERLIIQAVRGRRQIIWPEPRYASLKNVRKSKVQADMFAAPVLTPWLNARDNVIDWSIPGRWLDEMPGKKQYDGLPLSPKTLARIHAGLKRFGLKPFITGAGGRVVNIRGVNEPLNTVLPKDARCLVKPALKPFLVSHRGTSDAHLEAAAKEITEPLGTVSTSGKHHSLVSPFIVEMKGTQERQIENHSGRSIEEPLTTIATSGAHHSIVEPFIVGRFGEGKGEKPKRARSIDEPLPTVVGRGAGSLVEPFIVPIDHTGKGRIAVNDINAPLSTVTCEARHGLVEPYMVSVAHGDGCGRGNSGRAKSLDQPLGAVTGSNNFGLADPFLVPVAHGGGEGRCQSIEEPLPTVCGNRGDMAVIEPHLLGQQSGAALRPVSQPMPTAATAGAIALVEGQPFLVKFNGTGVAASVDDPMPTATTKDRLGLVNPTVEIDGQVYVIRLRWRMLQPHELAAGQSFPRGYKFTGNKSETVKQIGNAVPPELAAALLSCHLS